ncbi:MAG: class I SAM-dependent methyltransferase [Leptolyngbyaceae cyanobacterium SM1_4_3]|nr:class I SAM-dependent methyltransferase [Leptolyngbyaceae cyanobacterium SM1_4_3]
MESSASQITRAVQLQYEKFPYPPVPLSTPVRGMSITYSYLLAQYARIQHFQDASGKRALVAGCGTGYEIHQVAVANPGLAEVVGIDLSHRSVEFSRERIRHHHLDHCRAEVGNLLDPATLPAGQFDFIASYGVIHHTGDPELALRNLADKLAPGGVMVLMLYNRSGRMPVYRIRQALSLLGIDQMPIEQGMGFVWSLMEQAQPGTIFAAHSQGNREYYLQPENLVDNFFSCQ